jgi:hypothetical protein
MAPLPKIKARVVTQLPAAVVAGPAMKIVNANGIYTFSLDLSQIATLSSVAPDQISNQFVLSYNVAEASLSLLPFNIAVSDKVIVVKTDAGAVNVGEFDGIILINKGTPEATTINLPASDSKIGAVKIVDFAGNAGTYNITLVPSGSDVINGQTEWVIAGDGGSVVLDPVTGGWAL